MRKSERTHLGEYLHLLGLERVRNTSTYVFPRKGPWKDALFFNRAYAEVISDSCPKFLTFPIEDQLCFFNQAVEWPQERFIKYAKYCTAYPMAKFLHNDVPERPEGFTGNPLFAGKVKRVLKSRLISRTNRNARLFFGILQGVKRACAPVGPEFIQATMVKHRNALSSEPRGVAPDSRHLELYNQFFSNFKVPVPKLFEASTAASFDAKRSDGGARRFIRGQQEEGLIKMYEFRPGDVREVWGVCAPSFSDAVQLAKNGSRKVMVSAVLEPLKVRLITKGDSYRYWVSRFYQKALWQHLQKFPQFVLTGRPLMSGDLIDLKAREAKLGLQFPKWVSGDYSSATDQLDIRHTKAAFEASLRLSLFDYNSELRNVLRSVLYEQEIHYPKITGLPPVEQATGQLMGSTLSFPILCTVNLIGYWRAIEKYLNKELEVHELPVLVNGDDILFRADDTLYEMWQTEVKDLGFELSLGKNYIHRSLFTVNSQLYRDGDIPTHLKFFNAGLLIGQSKITGRQNAKLAPIWDYYNEVVHGAVSPLRAHRRFVHYHRSAIEEFTRKGQYNLFLPFERGGLGFNPPQGLTYKITSFQRRFASYLESKYVEDPTVINKIALVSGKNKSRLVLYHEPRIIVGPKVGPQLEHVVPIQEKEVNLPPLALEDSTETRPEMRVRLPRARTIREFRKGTFRRMGGAICSFGWKAYERTVVQEEDLRLIGDDISLPAPPKGAQSE
jgi:hypothetical protein